MKLIGFAVWDRRDGSGVNVTFPRGRSLSTASAATSRCCAQSREPECAEPDPAAGARGVPDRERERCSRVGRVPVNQVGRRMDRRPAVVQAHVHVSGEDHVPEDQRRCNRRAGRSASEQVGCRGPDVARHHDDLQEDQGPGLSKARKGWEEACRLEGIQYRRLARSPRCGRPRNGLLVARQANSTSGSRNEGI